MYDHLELMLKQVFDWKMLQQELKFFKIFNQKKKFFYIPCPSGRHAKLTGFLRGFRVPNAQTLRIYA
jgi:hypothetical protein